MTGRQQLLRIFKIYTALPSSKIVGTAGISTHIDHVRNIITGIITLENKNQLAMQILSIFIQ